MTIASRPSRERGTGEVDHIFRFSEIEIFLQKGLDSSGKTSGGFFQAAIAARFFIFNKCLLVSNRCSCGAQYSRSWRSNKEAKDHP